MYLVTFTAEINEFDEDYFTIAQQLQVKAKTQYNCLGFESYTIDSKEIAISKWQSLDDIKNWKQDELHLLAQKKGQEKWYKSYSVTISKVERSYSK